ncbi:sugar phosphate isomerase/epimerase family protein [Lederbergia lenta]|uniref:Sugar phosphate isomerase/epimerase n=1 Tax=Lederbergia lenta TaxID=1467 RepID=A0A2X4YZ22_LEDLE|nr:sugar phosphate isomerase/epimerase family protein [Lederbergia lenta]MCM3109381.1 sugar phosphate isomerase/epimerase [Lederbergia lenta]MEC2324854.1 sugar phosphate isomerase/epimerase [Lederbergia lenta]SQI57145.1 sugar phosphate isomerase/epimerase [Lederbergia lenta]
MGNIETIERLSLNQITTDKWNLREAVDGCARADIPSIAIWRHKLTELGLAESKKVVQDAGLSVSSLCRGGMFPAATNLERQERIEDNKRAIEEAAELGTDVLVLVCGPAPDKDIDAARKMVAEGIEQIIPFAQEHGIKLGIEPLHPMYAAERSVIVTLNQANTLVEQFKTDAVGVVVDVFHVWWDPDLYNQISRASGKILGYHVSDWIVPTPDLLMGRGMMGDGVIDLRKIRNAVEKAGYKGPIEVEIFNEEIWNRPGDQVLGQIKERYLEFV